MKYRAIIRPMPKKRHMIVAVKSQRLQFIKGYHKERKRSNFSCSTTFFLRSKKASSSIRAVIKVDVIRLPMVEFLPTFIYKKYPQYCLNYRRMGHLFRRCFTWRKIFDEKLNAGKIFFFFFQEGDASTSILSFSKHDEKR